jgi:dienelactone hydrolase
MSIPNGKAMLEASIGLLVRRLVRGLPKLGTHGDADAWTQLLLRFVHRYEPAEGRGPFPAAILLHGCGGDFRHLARWGRYLASRGLLAYTIDSLTPRGLGPRAARCLVCTGLRLRGSERCRDITTVLPFVLADRQVDRARIHLVGWSHGAWTITEWMLDAEAQSSARSAALEVRSVVLVYPYCGIVSGIHDRPWPSRAPVLVVTGAADRIVPNARTHDFVSRLARVGVPVTHVALDGVGHAFDVEGYPAFDAAKAAELEAGVVGFLRRDSL